MTLTGYDSVLPGDTDQNYCAVDTQIRLSYRQNTIVGFSNRERRKFGPLFGGLVQRSGKRHVEVPFPWVVAR